MYGHASLVCDGLSASVANDLCMGSHPAIMHNALSDCKRLLHYERDYALWMDTPNARLRVARQNAGFDTAVEAADAIGVPRSTYIGHENGHRGFPSKKAPLYARRFKVSEQWLLFGKGRPEDAPEPEATYMPNVEQLERMVETAMKEAPVGVKLGDFPPIVAAALHEQLARFQAGDVSQAEPASLWEERTARDKAARSRPATRRSGTAG